MKVITGSDNGLIKVYDVKTQQVVDAWGKQERDSEITSLVWKNKERSEIIAGHKSGLIRAFKLNGSVISSLKMDNPVIGLQSVSEERILACDSKGNILIANPKEKEGAVQFSLNRPVERILFSESLVSGCNKPKMPLGPQGRMLVLGGEGRLSQVIDIEQQSSVWQARNVPNDFLDLQVPIHDRAACWVDPAHTFCIVTAHHQIRLYDVRAQCRPTITIDQGTHPFSCVDLNLSNPNSVCVGDTIGNLRLHDLRKKFLPLGNFQGFSGGVRSMAFHPTEPVVAAVGLDRFVHICDTKTRKHTAKVYLTQRMNHCLIGDPYSLNQKTDEEEDESFEAESGEEYGSDEGSGEYESGEEYGSEEGSGDFESEEESD